MTASYSHSPLLQLARQLERDSSAYTVRVAGLIITCVGVLSLIVLSALGRNTTIAAALIPIGTVIFSIASRAAHRIAICRDTLTDRMLGAIADSELIPGWAKVEVAADYLARGNVPVATLAKIDLRIAEQFQNQRLVADSTPGAARLVARYGRAVETSGALDRSDQ
ncbi:hypothetical protein [Burkholderia cepacia]|uniref:hypothetical protein n=1 Tax=Burkholderia cepacia TaxID=292 RepID=UPI000758A0FD|nr:hypothetical protein [Burkholderia cepacia]KWC91709.1 hypothetical protein WL56_06150 [Burkholderia cepacia]